MINGNIYSVYHVAFPLVHLATSSCVVVVMWRHLEMTLYVQPSVAQFSLICMFLQQHLNFNKKVI